MPASRGLRFNWKGHRCPRRKKKKKYSTACTLYTASNWRQEETINQFCSYFSFYCIFSSIWVNYRSASIYTSNRHYYHQVQFTVTELTGVLLKFDRAHWQFEHVAITVKYRIVCHTAGLRCPWMTAGFNRTWWSSRIWFLVCVNVVQFNTYQAE